MLSNQVSVLTARLLSLFYTSKSSASGHSRPGSCKRRTSTVRVACQNSIRHAAKHDRANCSGGIQSLWRNAGGTADRKEKVMTHRTSQNPPPHHDLREQECCFLFFLPVPGIYLFLTGCGVRLWVNVCLCGCLIFPSGEWVIVDVAT